MSELEKPGESGEIVPYERGIRLAPALRGALLWFLPASTLSLAVVLFGLAGATLDDFSRFGSAVLQFSGVMALGFWMGLEGMRRWLYPDAQVDGRRSFVAGLMSSFVVFILAALDVPVEGSGTEVVLCTTGVVLAVLMFFAWLSPTPGADGAPDPEQVEDPALSASSALSVRDHK